jgi:toxin ParE1/3/4
MKVVYTESAKHELRAIALYIAKHNLPRAKSFSKELRLACQKLGEMPERFERVARYDSIRKRVHGNYVIFYKVAAEQVEIIHIYHGTMDLDAFDLGES